MNLMRIGIGTKILLIVGVVFILFTVGLATLIGATSFDNLTQVKQAELNRTSQILVSQIAQMERNAALAALRFDESEPIVAEIQLLTDRGPYYADPGSYFPADFQRPGGEIEDADKIYVFQSQLKLLQLLLPMQQLNNFSTIAFYHVSPFDIVPDAPPVLAFFLARDRIVLSQFQRKGDASEPRFYTIATQDFRPPAPDYFDISSAYAFPPEDFYRENHFVLADEPGIVADFPGKWREVERPVSELILEGSTPVIRTWYPVHAAMAHPETWEEALAPVGIVQIEQYLDRAAVAALSNQLGLDVALAQDGELLVTSLPDAGGGPVQRIGQEETVAIGPNAFNYAWKEIAFAGQGTGLQAVVLSPVSELAGPTDALRRQIIQLAVVMVLLAGILIYLILSYLLNRPLGALMDGVQRVSRGDLNHVVSVSSQDEVGQLGIAFNSMAEQLRGLIGSLEQRVDERTQELIKANRAAQIAREKAEAANRAKSEFLSYMSHELRTPLNGILGYTQILGKSGELTPQQVNGLTIIQQSGEHLLTLINDILDMTKIEAQKMELYPTAVDLPEFLENLANTFRFRANQSRLDFVYQVSDQLPYTVRVDEKRLRQILINLLSNAIRYTERGRVTFRVTRRDLVPVGEAASLYQPGQSSSLTLRFAVEDTGVGLSPKAIRDIFRPFEQLGEPRQRNKGTGLGLAISQNLAHIMGSEIKVRSRPGEGSVFWFDLTLPMELQAPRRQPPRRRRAIVGYRGPRRTILTVDDNLHNRSLIVDLLAPLGFRTFQAATGEEAIRLAKKHRPDLVFMDLRMEGMSGLEATRTIRQQAASREGGQAEIVIIAASASAFERDREASRVAGCDGFLAKPVQMAELFSLLEGHLGIQWIYADEAADSQPELGSSGTNGVGVSSLDGPALVIPPEPELRALLALAQRGMMRQIRERADHLTRLDPAYEPFAQRLRELAQGFREKDILAMIQEYI